MLNTLTNDISTTSASARRRAKITLLAIAGGASICLHGCDSRSDTTKAVEQSSRDMQTAGTEEAAAYKKVSNTLQPLADKGMPQENAAAQVILAKSQMGLAQPFADEAAAQERDSLNRATVIRSLVGAWASSSAQANSLSQFDPSAPINELKASAAEKQKLVEAQQKIKAGLDAKLGELRAGSLEKMNGAKAEENAYAALKEQASKLTAVMAEPVLKQAAERKRAADKLRTEGAMLDAQASVLAPQSAEAQLQIDQYQNQIKGFATATAELQERAKACRQEVEDSRKNAEKVASELDKLVQELRTQRGTPLTEPYEKAQQMLQSAVSSAGKAASADGGGASKLTQGVAQQALGDLAWSRARGQQAFELLVDALAKVEPPLPKSAEYAKESTDVGANRKELLTAAKDAYESAKSSFSSVRTQGGSREAKDAKDRLESLSEILGQLAQVADGTAKDLAAAKKPDAAAAPEAAPAAEPAPASSGTPAELTAAIGAVLDVAKEGDISKLKDHLLFTGNPADVEVIWSLVAAQDKLNKACKGKFGKSLTDIATGGGAMMGGSMGGGMGGADLDSLAGLTTADAKVTMKSDQEAEVMFGDQGKPQTFKLVDGTWKLDAGMDKLPPAQMAQLKMLAGPLSKAMDELAADVDAGKFNDGQALMAGLMQKMQAAMMGAQGGGGGGGGGG